MYQTNIGRHALNILHMSTYVTLQMLFSKKASLIFSYFI